MIALVSCRVRLAFAPRESRLNNLGICHEHVNTCLGTFPDRNLSQHQLERHITPDFSHKTQVHGTASAQFDSLSSTTRNIQRIHVAICNN